MEKAELTGKETTEKKNAPKSIAVTQSHKDAKILKLKNKVVHYIHNLLGDVQFGLVEEALRESSLATEMSQRLQEAGSFNNFRSHWTTKLLQIAQGNERIHSLTTALGHRTSALRESTKSTTCNGRRHSHGNVLNISLQKHHLRFPQMLNLRVRQRRPKNRR